MGMRTITRPTLSQLPEPFQRWEEACTPCRRATRWPLSPPCRAFRCPVTRLLIRPCPASTHRWHRNTGPRTRQAPRPSRQMLNAHPGPHISTRHPAPCIQHRCRTNKAARLRYLNQTGSGSSACRVWTPRWRSRALSLQGFNTTPPSLLVPPLKTWDAWWGLVSVSFVSVGEKRHQNWDHLCLFLCFWNRSGPPYFTFTHPRYPNPSAHHEIFLFSRYLFILFSLSFSPKTWFLWFDKYSVCSAFFIFEKRKEFQGFFFLGWKGTGIPLFLAGRGFHKSGVCGIGNMASHNSGWLAGWLLGFYYGEKGTTNIWAAGFDQFESTLGGRWLSGGVRGWLLKGFSG